MNLRTRVVGSILWTLAGGGTQIFLKLIVVAVLARLLTPSEFGAVAGAMLIVYLLELIASMGLGPSIIQRKELLKEHIMAAHLASTSLAILLSAALFVSSGFIAGLGEFDAVADVLPVLGLLLVIRSFGLPARYRLAREFKFRHLALTDIAAYSIGYGVVGLLMAVNGFGLWTLVAALLAEATIHSVVFIWLCPPQLSRQVRLHHLLDLTKFGIGASAAQFLSQLSLKIDEYIVAIMGDTHILGIYSRAKTTGFMPINRITGAAASVLFTAFSSIQDEKERVGRGLRRTLVFYTMIIMPGVAVLAVMGPEVIKLLLGPQWQAAILPFQILACALFLRGLTRFSGAAINSLGRSGILAFQQFIFAIVMLGACWIGAREGLAGVATGVLVATSLQVGLTFLISTRLIGWRITPFFAEVLRSAFVGAVPALLGMGGIWVARVFELHSLLVIVGAGLGLIVGGLLVVLACPMKVLGKDATWIFEMIGKTVIQKLPVLRIIGETLLRRFEATPQSSVPEE